MQNIKYNLASEVVRFRTSIFFGRFFSFIAVGFVVSFLGSLNGCAMNGAISEPLVDIRGQSPEEFRLTPFVDKKFSNKTQTVSNQSTIFRAGESIAAIRIEGNTTIPASAILPRIQMRKGTAVEQAGNQVSDDIKSIYSTGWFYTVEAEFQRTAQELVLVYRVVERPVLRSVSYVGNKKVKTKYLAGITGLTKGGAFSTTANKESVRRIREHYREKGFRFIEVTLAKGGEPSDRDVVFQIKEGPKVKVKRVKFIGNHAVRSTTLRLKLQTKPEFLWLFGGKYDPSSIPDDVAALKQYYLALGHFDIDIKEQVIPVGATKSGVRIEYHIHEGPEYKIRNILIEGNSVVSEKKIRSMMKVNRGDLFRLRHVKKDRVEILDHYGAMGRLYADVRAVPRYIDQPGMIDLVYQVKEDQVYRIGRINVNIRGTSHTKETVVLSQLRFAPGDLANPKLLRHSRRRLAGSPIWEAHGPQAPTMVFHKIKKPSYVTTPPRLDVARGQSGMSNSNGLPRRPIPVKMQKRNHLEKTTFSKTAPQTPADASPVNEPRSILPPGQFSNFDPNRFDNEKHNRKHNKEYRKEYRDVRKAFQQQVEQKKESLGKQSRVNRPTASLLYRPANEQSSAPTAPQTVSMTKPILGLEKDNAKTMLSTLFRFDEMPLKKNFKLGIAEAKSEATIFRAQSFDNFGVPPNPVYNMSPLGDPMGNQIRNPEPPPGYVDVDVGLNEAKTGRLMFSVGVSSDSGVLGSIVLEEQNFDITRFPTSLDDLVYGGAFRGNGEQFKIEIVPGDEVSRYTVSWTNPHFLGTDYSLGVSGFYFNRFYNHWTERRLGGRVTLGKQLAQNVTFSTSVRLEDVKVSNPSSLTVPELNEVLGSNFLSSVRLGLAWDDRDSAYLPTEGSFLEGSVEQAFGDFNYTKFQLSGSQYFTLLQRADGEGRHVLSVRGQLGFASSDLPVIESYYAGGVQTFRGFSFRGVTPRNQGVEIGGSFQALGTVEYSMPITANEAVRVVAFSDFGTVDDGVTFNKFRATVGGGLRLLIPQMGPVPIALDWAVPLTHQDDDREQLFQFYIGLTR